MSKEKQEDRASMKEFCSLKIRFKMRKMYSLKDPELHNLILLAEVAVKEIDERDSLKMQTKALKNHPCRKELKEESSLNYALEFPMVEEAIQEKEQSHCFKNNAFKEKALKNHINFEEGSSSKSRKDHHHDHQVPYTKKRKQTQAFDEEKNEKNVHIHHDDGDKTDFPDQEWVPKKKQKKSKSNIQKDIQVPLSTPPDLPQSFRNKINDMGGTDITLVIQKTLYKTDLNPHHNRLSMPLQKIINPRFLKETEVNALEKNQSLQVPLIQPSLEIANVTLSKWKMSISSLYVLRSTWIEVAKANLLKKDDQLQIWSFRVQDSLHMALVKL